MMDVTQDKLSEIRYSSFFNHSRYYQFSKIKIGKKITKTELRVFSQYSDETDLGPYSKVLIYGRNIPYNIDNHEALIKLIIRGYFNVYQVEKKTCKEYPTGFTYILRKENKDNVISTGGV